MPFERLIFIQHGLADNTGHWLMETSEWHRAAHALNLKWVGAAHLRLDGATASAYDLKPVFPFGPYDTVQATPLTSRLATFIELSDAFRDVGQRHFPADISAADLLFLPFSRDVEVLGVAKWLGTLPPQRRPTVAFVFHHCDLTWQVDTTSMSVVGDSSTWEYAARALLQCVPVEKIRFFGTGDHLSDILGKVFRIPTHTLPLVSPLPTQHLPAHRDKRYDVGGLGGARPEQGADQWADIFMSLAALRPNLTAALQLKSTSQEHELRDALRKVTPHAHVDIHTGTFARDDYYERMVNCRLVLLAYLPERYCFRESAVMVEAASRGIPVVAPARTSMARYIESGQAAGVVFTNGDAGSIAEAIHSALDQMEELHHRASALSETWSNKHKAENILGFLQK